MSLNDCMLIVFGVFGLIVVGLFYKAHLDIKRSTALRIAHRARAPHRHDDLRRRAKAVAEETEWRDTLPSRSI